MSIASANGQTISQLLRQPPELYNEAMVRLIISSAIDRALKAEVNPMPQSIGYRWREKQRAIDEAIVALVNLEGD
jgi:hypothetical protein